MWPCTNIKIMKNVEYRATFDNNFQENNYIKNIHTEVSFRVIPCLAFKVIECNLSTLYEGSTST